MQYQTQLTGGVAACVTGQKFCDRLIRAGRQLSDKLGINLMVMSAMPRINDEKTAQILEYLYTCSTDADAEMLVIYTDNPLDSLVENLKKRQVTHIILGQPRQHSNQMCALLMARYPDASYYAIDDEGDYQLIQACALKAQ